MWRGYLRHHSLLWYAVNLAMRRQGKGTDLRNQVLKSKARELVNQTVEKSAGVRSLGINGEAVKFLPIDPAALAISDGWERCHYPWRAVPEWKLKDPKGLDLALWHAQELCGLCYATPRRSRLRIKIILLEGQPTESHPLKGSVAPLMLMAVRVYAQSLRCKVIQIERPEPGVVNYYQALGFELDTAGCLVISADRF